MWCWQFVAHVRGILNGRRVVLANVGWVKPWEEPWLITYNNMCRKARLENFKKRYLIRTLGILKVSNSNILFEVRQLLPEIGPSLNYHHKILQLTWFWSKVKITFFEVVITWDISKRFVQKIWKGRKVKSLLQMTCPIWIFLLRWPFDCHIILEFQIGNSEKKSTDLCCFSFENTVQGMIPKKIKRGEN